MLFIQNIWSKIITKKDSNKSPSLPDPHPLPLKLKWARTKPASHIFPTQSEQKTWFHHTRCILAPVLHRNCSCSHSQKRPAGKPITHSPSIGRRSSRSVRRRRRRARQGSARRSGPLGTEMLRFLGTGEAAVRPAHTGLVGSRCTAPGSGRSRSRGGTAVSAELRVLIIHEGVLVRSGYHADHFLLREIGRRREKSFAVVWLQLGFGSRCSWAGKAICSWWSARRHCANGRWAGCPSWSSLHSASQSASAGFSRLECAQTARLLQKKIQHPQVKEGLLIPKSNTELALTATASGSHKNAHLSLAKNHSKLAGYVSEVPQEGSGRNVSLFSQNKAKEKTSWVFYKQSLRKNWN